MIMNVSLKKKKKTDKKPNKIESPKKPTENSVKELSKLVNKEETSTNRGLFQNYFSIDRPSVLIKGLLR